MCIWRWFGCMLVCEVDWLSYPTDGLSYPIFFGRGVLKHELWWPNGPLGGLFRRKWLFGRINMILYIYIGSAIILTRCGRWTIAENARGAQYQPCRDVTFFDFHENWLRTHVEISRKSAITFFVFRFRRQKGSYSAPLDLPVTPVCLNTINCFKLKWVKKKTRREGSSRPTPLYVTPLLSSSC